VNIKKKFLLIQKKAFIKKLISGKINRSSGTNFTGKKTVRSRGFINKKKYRSIDYFRAFWHVQYVVMSFNYDPNRKTLINCIQYCNQAFSFILSVSELKLNSILMDGNFITLKNGSSTIIKNIYKKFKICNLESNLFKGAKLVRSSSSYSKIINKKKNFCTVLLPSKKLKVLSIFCTATIGSIFNFDFNFGRYKKASYYRYKGFRPLVRGVAMNPIDHPHGGGEGKKSKKKDPVSIWGKKLNFKKNNVKR